MSAIYSSRCKAGVRSSEGKGRAAREPRVSPELGKSRDSRVQLHQPSWSRAGCKDRKRNFDSCQNPHASPELAVLPATAEAKAQWGSRAQLQLSTQAVVQFQQRVLLETSVSGCLFQRWHFLPAGLTSPIAHTILLPPSHLSPAHAALGPLSPSHEAPPSWKSLARIGRQDPGTEGRCLEQQHVGFWMGGRRKALWCSLWDAGSWLGADAQSSVPGRTA